MNFTPQEREAYEEHLKWFRDEASALKKHEQKGREKGKIERNIEIARKMLAKNHSLSDISDLTDLSPEEISKL